VDGIVTVPQPQNLAFALLPLDARPALSDWQAPVPEPGGNANNLGLQVTPVPGPSIFGIWVKIVDNPNIPVLDPSVVGRVVRT
jgi:hypothetical protein